MYMYLNIRHKALIHFNKNNYILGQNHHLQVIH